MRYQTILQLLNQLPEPYRSQAIAQAHLQGRVKQLNETPLNNTTYGAITCAFNWHISTQGRDYWHNYTQTLLNQALKLNL